MKKGVNSTPVLQYCQMAPEELVKAVIQALEREDFNPLFDAIRDDVVWKSAATSKGLFSFGGRYVGREGMEEWKNEIETDYVIRSIAPKEIIRKDEVIWSLLWVDLFYKPTSALVSFDCAVRWQFRDGKVAERQAFIDTAALLIREQSGFLEK
jgi:ketosteroid isomerase-like protein